MSRPGRPGTELFRTHPADAAVAASGWRVIGPGLEVTAEPLVDLSTPPPHLYARLSQLDAEAACRALFLRLPTRAEVLLALNASHLIPPVLLPHDHLMASRGRCEEHDRTVRTHLASGVPQSPAWPAMPPWDGRKPAGNIGKHRIHVQGLNPRIDEAICGWRKRDGTLWQQGFGAIPHHHGPAAATRVDYGTTTIAVRQHGLSMPPVDPGKPPGEPKMRATIRRGSTGSDVEALQAKLGLKADGQFGPVTEGTVKAFQRTKGLHDDGIVGPQTWRALGEVPSGAAASAGHLPSAACKAALRDANATWPARSKSSDGIMGDAAHQARPSAHNLGNAVDITHDPDSGCDGELVWILARRDRRVANVIWRRRIWNPKLDEFSGPGRPYTGSNPHLSHVHIEIHAHLRDEGSPWPWAPPPDVV